MSFLNWLLNRRILLLLLLFVALPPVLYGAAEAWKSNSNNVADWMPDDFDATKQLFRFAGLFGNDEMLMISWDGCSLDDPRIGQYRDELLRPQPDLDPKSDRSFSLFRKVVSGPDVLRSLQSPPLRMSRNHALARMVGWIVSPDGKHTCLIARVSKEGMADRHRAVALTFEAADRVDGLSSDAIHVAGGTIESVAIDQASLDSLIELNLASYAICLAIMIVFLRNVRIAIMVFLLAIFNEYLSLAIIYYWGVKLDSILLLVANLTFVLTISVGIHLVNYYRDELKERSKSEAAVFAFRVAFRPTVLASITTAIGLVSLSISELVPISRFGAFSAVSILLAVAVTLVYASLHFHMWPLSSGLLSASAVASRNGDSAASVGGATFGKSLLGISRRFVLLATAVVLIFGFLGAGRLTTMVGLSELLSPEARSVKDYAYLEEKIGPLIPVQVIIEMPVGDAAARIDQYRTVRELHRSLAEMDRKNVAMSVATFAPAPPLEPKGGFSHHARNVIFRRWFAESEPQFQEMGYLQFAGDHVWWRVSLQVPASANVHYGELMQNIRSTMSTVFEALPEDQRPSDTIVCGGVPLVHQVQEQMLDDLISSFILTFVLVSVTLMVLFRSVACGLICMIPNVLPSAVVFGIFGWYRMPVDIGTILTASTALGVAVDDSLHYITWFRRSMLDGATIAQAVRFAYRRCATAMVQTTLICSLGLLVFSVSSFAPMARFGWCMFSLLTLALVADLIVLPCILLSPLGRPFIPKERRASSKDQ